MYCFFEINQLQFILETELKYLKRRKIILTYILFGNMEVLLLEKLIFLKYIKRAYLRLINRGKISYKTARIHQRNNLLV